VRRIRLEFVLALAVLGLAVGAAGAGAQTTPHASLSHNMVFFSTQLTPVQEAQAMRETILRGFNHRVQFVPATDDRTFEDRVIAEVTTGRGSIDVLGALHGSYVSLRERNALRNLNDVRRQLRNAGIPNDFLALGRLGGRNQLYIPWMQATYIMVANRRVLPLVPRGADYRRLTYAQLLTWARNIRERFGVGRLGFPAGDQGLWHRFLQGYLVPAFSGGNVTKWNSAGAVAGWQWLKNVWRFVHPQSLTYGFMQDPLLSGEVLLAWDHVARLKNALVQRPQDFVAFPAPAGPRGRAYMPVLSGLAIPRSASNPAAGKQLIRYLLGLSAQARTLSTVGFFPVRKGRLSKRLGPGLLREASAVQRTLNARDRLPSLLPIGLGGEGGNFNRIYRDTFTRIVIRGEAIRPTLRAAGEQLQAIFQRTGAPCWRPDPNRKPCRVG
jgi:multiple sugar transport system substrate-binding protein